MSGGYCSYCRAQTAWESDRQNGLLYCTRCRMQPRPDSNTPQCQSCGMRAGFYDDHQRGARHYRYCRNPLGQMKPQTDPRYAPDPLQGVTCAYCGRGDEIYNTVEAGGHQQTMCRRCRRPLPQPAAPPPQQQQNDVRTYVNPQLFQVYDEFDPHRMRKRFENIQPSFAGQLPPQPGQVPTPPQPQPPLTSFAQKQASIVSLCSNCRTSAYVKYNPQTRQMQCTRCGQWVGSAKTNHPPVSLGPSWCPQCGAPSNGNPLCGRCGAPVTEQRAQPRRHGLTPTLQSIQCQDCGVRGVVKGNQGEVVCPQCQRQIRAPNGTPTIHGSGEQGSLANIQSLFEPGSPERSTAQPNRVGHRDDDIYGF